MSYKEGNLHKTQNYFSNKTKDKTTPKDKAQLNGTGSFKQEKKKNYFYLIITNKISI